MNKTDWREMGLLVSIVLGINVVFVLLAAPVYWLLGVPKMIGPLALGFAALWAVLLGVFVFSQAIEYFFRLNLYDHSTRYILLNASLSAVPLLGWSATMALRAHQFAAGATIGVTIALFVIGFLACYTAHTVFTGFFHGQIYVLINIIVTLGGYLMFAFWPAAARALFGWLVGVGV
jgi:hypothetical protein